MSRFQAVFFDVDDTLFDRCKAQVEVARLFKLEYPAIFKDRSIAEMEDTFLQSDRLADETYYPVKNIDIFRVGRARIFLELLGLDPNNAEIIADAYVRLYQTVNASIADLPDLLSKLQLFCRLGIISNGFQDVQNGKLVAIGAEPYFETVLISGGSGLEKPNSGIFMKACELMQVNPDECLYVGDSYQNDVVGAKQAGMKACWYNPKQKKINHEIQPDYEIDRLESLLQIVN